MSSAEIDHVIADSGAKLVIRHADDVPRDAPHLPPAEAAAGDVAALFYTSGTTEGNPRARH